MVIFEALIISIQLLKLHFTWIFLTENGCQCTYGHCENQPVCRRARCTNRNDGICDGRCCYKRHSDSLPSGCQTLCGCNTDWTSRTLEVAHRNSRIRWETWWIRPSINHQLFPCSLCTDLDQQLFQGQCADTTTWHVRPWGHQSHWGTHNQLQPSWLLTSSCIFEWR